tara:strand:- start:459 stop:908 length:450 start_codon:yes stop_codon:yes gene_type:complete
MAILPSVFIPEETDENPFAPIDAGWVLAEISKSEIKVTKDKKGKYIALSFKLDEDEENAGRMVYTNLNIVNSNETAVKIARADLKAICTAVGHEGELEDTEDLHGIPMAIKLSVKAETSQWPAKNEIKAFKNADELPALRGDSDDPLED